MKKYLAPALAAVLAFAGVAVAQNVSNYMEQGGARWVVGGELDVVSGGSLKIGGTAITATAAELNQVPVMLPVNSIGTASATGYVVAPATGTITTMYVVADAANNGGATVFTPYIKDTTGATPMTRTGALTLTSGLAAGTADSVTISALNSVTAGQVIMIESDGGTDVSSINAMVSFAINR